MILTLWPNKEKTAHNRDRKYWKTRWWAKRQTWAIAAWPAVCWVKHSALLECVCECVWVFQRREGGSWAHRGIVGSSVTGFLPLPGYKQCSASFSLSRCSSPYSLISSLHIFLSCFIFTSMFTLHYVCSCSSNDGWQDRSEDSDNVMTSSLKAVRPRVSFHLKQNSRKMFLHPNEAATAILQPSHKNKC